MYTKLLLFTTATFLLFTGCSTKNPKPLQIKKQNSTTECKIYGESAPSWICKTPKKQGYYTATGFAKKSVWGFAFMRNNAVLDANTQIARQISVKVANYVTNYLSELGNNGVGDKAIEQFTKQIVYATTLKNSKIKDMWFDSKGNMYVLVSVPKAQNLEQIKQKITSSFNNKKALWQQFKAQQAEQKLNKETQGGE